jgi:NDP-sugar pyrophosphorylase family protein
VEEEPLGTAGAIKNAEPFLEDDVFVATNGDVVTDLPVKPLLEALADADAAVALVPLRSPYGIVEFDELGRVVSFREKPVLGGYFINAGVYAMRRELLKVLPSRGNIEETTFPQLAERKRLKAVVYSDVFWRSIDTVKDLEEVERILGNGN